MTEGQPRCSCCILKWRKLFGSYLGERDCAVLGRQAEVRTDLWLVLSDRNCKYMFFAKNTPFPASPRQPCFCKGLLQTEPGWLSRGFGRGKRGNACLQGGILRAHTGRRLFVWPQSELTWFSPAPATIQTNITHV